ncbi:ATP-dependent RNA helicase TDRD9 [Nephila pilipes]|uniref:Probable ATP-dependent RNA helicase spindle-E n=1 Tax=Nephila pilipes TaxID=299642 RepID=A0A8X6N119_NEPPI|nr:ATP-dependent RNA helicase TDRD9 [Nephila pilipes]
MDTSLDRDLQLLDITPTNTDCIGFNNSKQETLPINCIHTEEETESVKNILDRDRKLKNSSRICSIDLAITTYREEILLQIETNPVTIIQGPIGCGKTTQVPQYILDYHQSKGSYCNIIVTQPRKIAAISIARRVCQERKWQLGSIVGYQVALNSKSSPGTQLNYVTTGVLLENLANAKRMDMYTHIIIDEVHERNQEVDFAILLVKKFLMTNSQSVKIILMSATFDASEFTQYFSLTSLGNSVPILEIEGKSKDVTEHYLHDLKFFFKKIPDFERLNPNIDSCLYDGVLNLIHDFDRIEKSEQKVRSHNSYATSKGAVLIFLPGYEEICTLSNKLQAADVNKHFWIISLHSTISLEEQTKAFLIPSCPDIRKVILSTNIAENSITVLDVKYVIDFCLTKNLVTDSLSNYTCLQLEWASKANCIQRKGRVGRVDTGKVYRIVPLKFYNSLPDYSIPEIKRCPLTKTILQIKKLDLCKPQQMLSYALNPPNLCDITCAVMQLKVSLGLTTKSCNPLDGDLTFIGRVMSHLPLDIKLSKLIIFGYVFHCLEDCIIIAASLSLQNFFAEPSQRSLESYKSRLSWADNTFSDCLGCLNAYRMWKQRTLEGLFKRPGGLLEFKWARLHFIQLKRIKEVDLLVKDIKARLEKFSIFADDNHQFKNAEESRILILKILMAGSFFPYYYVQEPLDEKQIHKDIIGNDPLCTVSISGLPPKHGILYATALKEMFSCYDENISIQFEKNRGYIKFLSNYEKSTSPIHPALYYALKMRKLKPLELSVFSHEEAEKKAQQLLSSKQAASCEFGTKSCRVTVMEWSALKRTPLPSLTLSMTTIVVTWVNNCGHFWARYLTPDISKRLDSMERNINENEGRNLLPLTEFPRVNMLYLAPYVRSNNKPLYYRVRVQELKFSDVVVLFVDYGYITTMHYTKLREIPESTPLVLNTSALAVECYLAGIKPSSCKISSGKWCEQANVWFKRKVYGKLLYAKIYSRLINLEYAEPAEESYASKESHDLRCNVRHSNKKIYENIIQDIELSWNETEDNSIKKTKKKIRLQGPFNPLEISYCGLTNFDCSKSVKVEQASVNSISFNAEPQYSYSSMLIASQVEVGQNDSDLILRNTTLLPKILGLPTLICLLFSPYSELRTDIRQTSYTGALCGLGFNSLTGEPISPDHDIELAFDVEISLADIQEINAVRMGFNLLFSSESDTLLYTSDTLSLIHEKTERTMIDLLKKKRASRKPIYSNEIGQWNSIPSEFLLESPLESSFESTNVLPLLKPTRLITFENDNLSQDLK